MANKSVMAIYIKQQGKCKIKKPTLYIPKGNIKKSNKIKKDVDKVSKVCYYPIVARARKRKLKSKSEIEIKMGW